jgi:tetratricopeptide (TPR) repeat protein
VDAPIDRRVTRADIHVWHERKPGAAADARGADKTGAELEHLRAAWEQRQDRRALFYLANGLRESGRHDEAIAAYAEYLRAPNFAEEGWQAQLYMARCHAALRNWDAAARAFEAAVIVAPQRGEAIVGLAYVLLETGDVRRATAWFRMATTLPQPCDCRLFVEVPVYRWGAWHGLALALHAAGDHAGAADAEQRAADGGAGAWAHENVAWWRARAGSTVR